LSDKSTFLPRHTTQHLLKEKLKVVGYCCYASAPELVQRHDRPIAKRTKLLSTAKLHKRTGSGVRRAPGTGTATKKRRRRPKEQYFLETSKKFVFK
jgi:hypothetical protein